MIGIILAAGVGSRLMPFTKDIPKSLLKIGNHSVLEHIIQKCHNGSIKSYVVVVGHGKNRVKEECRALVKKYGVTVRLVYNQKYAESNTAYSLYLALRKLSRLDDIVIVNGDDLFDGRIISNLLTKAQTTIVVDNVKVLDRESIKVVLDGDAIKGVGKHLHIGKPVGEFIGISRVSRGDIATFMGILKKLEHQEFYDVAFKDLSEKTVVDILYTDGLKWMEIDTLGDFKSVEEFLTQLA